MAPNEYQLGQNSTPIKQRGGRIKVLQLDPRVENPKSHMYYSTPQ